MIADVLDTRTSATLEDSALALAALGFRVHPLVPSGKNPLLQNWQALAGTDAGQIAAWWQENPGANIGAVIGAGWLTLDVDRHPGQADGYHTLADLAAEHGTVPPTWTITNGVPGAGDKRLYRLPSGCRPAPYARKIGPGLEVLGDGHNIVMPGSTHLDHGTRYTWFPGLSPADMLAAEAPGWLLALVDNSAPAHARRDLDTSEGNHARNTGTQHYLRDLPARLTGQDVAGLLARWDVAEKCLVFLGIDTTSGPEKPLRCPLHAPDQHPSAVILGPTEQHPTFSFYCHHEARAISLPELYYRAINGHGARLKKASFLVWSVRLLRAAGILPDRPGTPKAARLWAGASEAVRAVYDIFVELLACRAWITGRAAPFSWRFCATWRGPGLTEHAISKAVRHLIARAYLLKAGVDSGLQLFTLGSRLARHLLQAGQPGRTLQTTTKSTGAALALIDHTLKMQEDSRADVQHPGGVSFCPCVECVVARQAQARLEEICASRGGGGWVSPSTERVMQRLGAMP